MFYILFWSFGYSIVIPSKISFSKTSSPYEIYNYFSSQIQLSEKHWSFVINPIVLDAHVGEQILGTSFERMKLHGRFTHSFIQFKKDGLHLFLGREPLIWGQSKERSIIQSGSLATYDQFRFQLKMGILTGEIFTGQLGSERFKGERITRRIGGHRVTGHFLNNTLELQAGEQIIYTGVDRNIELFYLNPAVPYVFAVYDGDDVNTNEYNNDNGMIFLNGRYNFKSLSVYVEFIMDDFQVHENQTQDMLGYKLGIEGRSNITNYNLNWITEYTKIDTWTYIHHGQTTNWQNRGHPIGYPYGGDLQSFHFVCDTWIRNETVQLNIEYTWLKKGTNNINSEWGNDNTLNTPFPSKPVNVFHLFETSILYKTKYVSVQTGYTNKPFLYEIANGLIDELKGGFFLSAGLHYQLDINLKE